MAKAFNVLSKFRFTSDEKNYSEKEKQNLKPFKILKNKRKLSCVIPQISKYILITKISTEHLQYSRN